MAVGFKCHVAWAGLSGVALALAPSNRGFLRVGGGVLGFWNAVSVRVFFHPLFKSNVTCFYVMVL